jgi:EmrB/QacA subfamily drug resistance transporter
VLCVTILVINLDNTILNVALPTLVKALQAKSSELQLIVDSYAVVFAGLLLVGGSLADRFGRKPLLLAGLCVFGGGSVGSAFSGSVWPLISWRAVMGIGAAMTVPATLSVINDIFPDPAERARAIGAWAGTSGLGIAIGPIAGGVLLAHFWWGSVFFVNVPIVVAGVAAAYVLVPNSRNPCALRPDPVGGLLSIGGLGALLWAIIEAPSRGWGSTTILVSGGGGLAFLVLFVLWEAMSTHPMLNLAFFRNRRFSAAAAPLALGVFGLFGALFVQTQFLQFDLGYTPVQAGVRILPLAAVLAVAAPLSPRAAAAFGSKVTAATGMLAIAGGLFQISTVSHPGAGYLDFLPGMLLLGAGAGLLMPTATDSVLGSLPRGDAGVGSATNGVCIQVGGAVGVGVIGSILATRYQDQLGAAIAPAHVPGPVSHTILGSLGGALEVASRVGGTTGQALSTAARTAFLSGVGIAFATASCVAAVGALVILAALPSRAPQG